MGYLVKVTINLLQWTTDIVWNSCRVEQLTGFISAKNVLYGFQMHACVHAQKNTIHILIMCRSRLSCNNHALDFIYIQMCRVWRGSSVIIVEKIGQTGPQQCPFVTMHWVRWMTQRHMAFILAHWTADFFRKLLLSLGPGGRWSGPATLETLDIVTRFTHNKHALKVAKRENAFMFSIIKHEEKSC